MGSRCWQTARGVATWISDEAGCADDRPGGGPAGLGGRDQGDHGVNVLAIEQTGHFGDPAHVLVAVGFAETEILRQAQAEVVTVQDHGKASRFLQAQGPGFGQGRLARAGKTGEPTRFGRVGDQTELRFLLPRHAPRKLVENRLYWAGAGAPREAVTYPFPCFPSATLLQLQPFLPMGGYLRQTSSLRGFQYIDAIIQRYGEGASI